MDPGQICSDTLCFLVPYGLHDASVVALYELEEVPPSVGHAVSEFLLIFAHLFAALALDVLVNAVCHCLDVSIVELTVMLVFVTCLLLTTPAALPCFVHFLLGVLALLDAGTVCSSSKLFAHPQQCLAFGLHIHCNFVEVRPD